MAAPARAEADWAATAQTAQGEDELPSPATLSPRIVAYCHAILHKAIEDAIRDGTAGLERNVVGLVEPPKDRGKNETITLTADEASALLVQMAEDRLWCYWLVAFAVGFRRGEGLGMRWPDLDLDNAVWRPKLQVQRIRGEVVNEKTGRRKGKLIAKELKTEASSEPVALPRAAVDAFKRWRPEQNQIRMAARVWADLDLVFTTGIGTALEPRNVNRAWERVRERAGVRPIAAPAAARLCQLPRSRAGARQDHPADAAPLTRIHNGDLPARG